MGTLIKFIKPLKYVYKLKRGYKLPKKSLNNYQYGQKFHFCVQFQPKFSKIGMLFIGSPGMLNVFTNVPIVDYFVTPGWSTSTPLSPQGGAVVLPSLSG